MQADTEHQQNDAKLGELRCQLLVSDKASGKVVITGGSPGGALIIHYTAKTLYGVLNWGLTPQEAINLPNFGSTNGPTVLEEKRFPTGTVEVTLPDGTVRSSDPPPRPSAG